MKSPAIVEKINDKVIAIALNQALKTGEILETIMLPQNLNILGRQLPKPNYTSQIKLRSVSYQQKRDTSELRPRNVIISNHPNDKLIRPRLEINYKSKPLLPSTKPYILH